jgi:hypothetical protein
MTSYLLVEMVFFNFIILSKQNKERDNLKLGFPIFQFVQTINIISVTTLSYLPAIPNQIS